MSEGKNETTIAAVNYYGRNKEHSVALLDCWGFTVQPYGKKVRIFYQVPGFSEVFTLIVDEVGLYHNDDEADRLKKKMAKEIAAIQKITPNRIRQYRRKRK